MTDKTPDPCGSDSSTELGDLKRELSELRAENTRLKARLALKDVRKDEMSAVYRALTEMEREREERKAALPPGTCHDCNGDGEQGGQFCGGYWKCLTCGGSGKSPNTEVDRASGSGRTQS